MRADHDLIATTLARRPVGMALALKTMYETVLGQTLALDMTERLFYGCATCLDHLHDYERGSVCVPMPDGATLMLMFTKQGWQYTIETIAPQQSPIAQAWIAYFGQIVQLDRVVEAVCVGS